jgi:hypothetical protein
VMYLLVVAVDSFRWFALLVGLIGVARARVEVDRDPGATSDAPSVCYTAVILGLRAILLPWVPMFFNGRGHDIWRDAVDSLVSWPIALRRGCPCPSVEARRSGNPALRIV